MSDYFSNDKDILDSLQDGVREARAFLDNCEFVASRLEHTADEFAGVETSRNVGAFVQVSVEAFYDDITDVPLEVIDEFPGDGSVSVKEQGGRYRVYLRERKSY